jgi:hypothetical protein
VLVEVVALACATAVFVAAALDSPIETGQPAAMTKPGWR